MFPFKACIEDQLQRLADALTVSLRNAVLSNFKAVDAFLEDSMEKLSRRPRTIDDIGEVMARVATFSPVDVRVSPARSQQSILRIVLDIGRCVRVCSMWRSTSKISKKIRQFFVVVGTARCSPRRSVTGRRWSPRRTTFDGSRASAWVLRFSCCSTRPETRSVWCVPMIYLSVPS